MNTIMRYLFIIKFIFFFVLFQEVIVFNNKVIAEQFELKNFKESAYGEIYLQAIEMYKENLIFGIGLNNYNELCLTEKYKKLLGNIDCVTHPHNFYLQWLVETGPICLILFILYLYYV